MSIATQTFTPVSGTIIVSGATDVKITNFPVLVANTEYSHALTTGLKQLTIKNRDRSTTKIAFISGDSLLNYITIYPGAVFSVGDLTFSGKILYFNCSVVSTLEIVELY